MHKQPLAARRLQRGGPTTPGTADPVIAHSLLGSAAILIGRAVAGLVFIRGFWKRRFRGGGYPHATR